MDVDPAYNVDEVVTNTVILNLPPRSNHVAEGVQDCPGSMPRDLDWVVDREPQNNEVGDNPTLQTPIHKNTIDQLPFIRALNL